MLTFKIRYQEISAKAPRSVDVAIYPININGVDLLEIKLS